MKKQSKQIELGWTRQQLDAASYRELQDELRKLESRATVIREEIIARNTGSRATAPTNHPFINTP